MFPEGMDMNALLQQAQQMQTQIKQAQAQLAESTFTGTAGGDLITATVNGQGMLVALDISPDAVDVDDLESLSDLIIAAVRDASSQVTERAQSLMPDLGGMGL